MDEGGWVKDHAFNESLFRNIMHEKIFLLGPAIRCEHNQSPAKSFNGKMNVEPLHTWEACLWQQSVFSQDGHLSINSMVMYFPQLHPSSS